MEDNLWSQSELKAEENMSIVFGADPVDVDVSFFVSMLYLLNQLMDF